MITDPAVVKETVGERARQALTEIRGDRAPTLYLVSREPRRLEVPTSLLDVTGTRPSSGWACFLTGAACAALTLAALYFSI